MAVTFHSIRLEIVIRVHVVMATTTTVTRGRLPDEF